MCSIFIHFEFLFEEEFSTVFFFQHSKDFWCFNSTDIFVSSIFELISQTIFKASSKMSLILIIFLSKIPFFHITNTQCREQQNYKSAIFINKNDLFFTSLKKNSIRKNWGLFIFLCVWRFKWCIEIDNFIVIWTHKPNNKKKPMSCASLKTLINYSSRAINFNREKLFSLASTSNYTASRGHFKINWRMCTCLRFILFFFFLVFRRCRRHVFNKLSSMQAVQLAFLFVTV